MHVNRFLLNIYQENVDQNQNYKYYLKARIKLKYPDKIIFISHGYRIQEVLISGYCLDKKTIAKSILYPRKFAIPKTAEILSKCVRDMINSLSIVSWQPKVQELQWDERKPPELVQHFYKTLLLSKNKSKT